MPKLRAKLGPNFKITRKNRPRCFNCALNWAQDLRLRAKIGPKYLSAPGPKNLNPALPMNGGDCCYLRIC